MIPAQTPTPEPRADAPDLDALRRLSEAATPGPWRWAYPGSDSPVLMGTKGDESYSFETEVIEAEHYGECGCRSACHLTVTMDDGDACLIPAMRNALPWLLDQAARVTELEAENERLKTWQAKRIVAISQDPMCIRWMRQSEQAQEDAERAEGDRDAARAEAQRLRKQIAAALAAAEDIARRIPSPFADNVVSRVRAALSSPASEKP